MYLKLLLILVPGFLVTANAPCAQEYYGFTVPNREIRIGSPEAGIVSEIHVEVGEEVTVGQVLARLDTQVLEAALAEAKARVAADGRIAAAQAGRDLRREQLRKLERLEQSGHARADELIVARAELRIAEAEVQTRLQERNIQRLQHAQIEAQIAHRELRSPIKGIVTEINKDVAERIGLGSDESIMTVVELDPLLIEIFVSYAEAAMLSPGQELEVHLDSLDQPILAKVQHIVPTIDPESETTSVMLRFPNPDYAVLSGLRGTIRLGTSRPRAAQPDLSVLE